MSDGFRLLWANAAADVAVGDFAILGDFVPGDEENGVCAGWHMGSDTLGWICWRVNRSISFSDGVL